MTGVRVVLFRHGPAARRDSARWPDDGARPLTKDGEERTRAAARGLARVIPARGVIWSSPLKRALQTASILAGAWKTEAAVWTHDALTPGTRLTECLAALRTLHPDGGAPRTKDAVDDGATVILVGHEPDL